MRYENLRKLGIELDFPVPIPDLFSERYTGRWDNISTGSLERIGIIREIIREYNSSEEHIGETIKNSYDAANAFRDYFRGLSHEECVALYLDTNCHVLRRIPITSGSADSTYIDASAIIRNAILLSSRRFIIAHNHPSGDPHPSAADIRETQKLRDACKIMDMALSDHIILSSSRFFSYDEGLTHRYQKETTNTTSPNH